MDKATKHRLLNTPVKTIHRDTPPQDAETDADVILPHFEQAFANAPNNDFLESIYIWWQDKGFLTEKQFEALQKFSGVCKINIHEEEIPF